MANDNTAVFALILIGIIAATSLFMLGSMRGGYYTALGTTPSGTAKVDIGESLSITLIDDMVDFGTGYVISGSTSASIDSSVASAGDNWTSTAPGVDGWPGSTDYMTLENNGNVPASVTISASKSAATFIGGTSPAQQYKGADNEGGSCTGAFQDTYDDLTTGETNLCTYLGYGDARDAINIYFKLKIPSDASPNSKENTLTFTGTKA